MSRRQSLPNRCRSETTAQRTARYHRQRANHAADNYARIKHGTTHGANMGCPCQPCRTAGREYKQHWRHGPVGKHNAQAVEPLPVRKPQVAHDNELRAANAQGIRPPRAEENGTSRR